MENQAASTILKRKTLHKTADSGASSSKIKTFYPLVGSIADCKKNITDILSDIGARKLTRTETIKWMADKYKANTNA